MDDGRWMKKFPCPQQQQQLPYDMVECRFRLLTTNILDYVNELFARKGKESECSHPFSITVPSTSASICYSSSNASNTLPSILDAIYSVELDS
eukprot:scaffold395_cov265-Chaetoceros_neogracile.AAC.40